MIFRRKPKPQNLAAIGPASVVAAKATDVSTSVHYDLSPGSVRAAGDVRGPERLVRLPFHLRTFVGRTAELALLDQALAGPGSAVIYAAHGLDGIGKSALAAHWADRRRTDPGIMWWITADSPASLATGLADLAVALQPALAEWPEESAASWATSWLSSHDEWLLILDNVADQADVRALLATARNGRFLITTQRTGGWRQIAVPVRLDVLRPDEAVELLRRVSDVTDLAGAADLCADLDYLPLAIEQVGAYLLQTGLSPAESLRLLDTSEPLDSDAEHAVTRLWHITLDRLSPEAARLLRVLAWWSPDDIPRSLLTPLLPEPVLGAALDTLADYRLISLADGTISVHRRVQALARTPGPRRSPEEIAQARDQALHLLREATEPLMGEPQAFRLLNPFVPHAEALLEHFPPEDDTSDMVLLLGIVGSQFLVWNQHEKAIVVFERALDAGHTWVDQESREVLFQLENNLAVAHGCLGDHESALAFLRERMARYAAEFGADAPLAIEARVNLADALHAARRSDEAAALFERIIAEAAPVLGPGHHLLQRITEKLAELRPRTTGSSAIPLLEDAYTTCLRDHGADDPRTSTARARLIDAYMGARDFTPAIPLLEEEHAHKAGRFGLDHDSAITVRSQLVLACVSTGDTDRLRPLGARIDLDLDLTLGPDHPSARSLRESLPFLRDEA
ncbi:tetratricopeptide repeat protein [Nonomuraea soli]|uniref:Tetratricopeptide (TPR) repeat protein n=1 Tax=Nonomuraea soli TaxID=1032476 RepID=A0A7W0CS33_9ACTN|nr:tetratricopeptide repeat protein [Nonomuraea soli]MBA2896174.1 tetratricopeptide (TPR) repeat protein [Nonomuraea soli]